MQNLVERESEQCVFLFEHMGTNKMEKRQMDTKKPEMKKSPEAVMIQIGRMILDGKAWNSLCMGTTMISRGGYPDSVMTARCTARYPQDDRNLSAYAGRFSVILFRVKEIGMTNDISKSSDDYIDFRSHHSHTKSIRERSDDEDVMLHCLKLVQPRQLRATTMFTDGMTVQMPDLPQEHRGSA